MALIFRTDASLKWSGCRPDQHRLVQKADKHSSAVRYTYVAALKGAQEEAVEACL